MEPKFQLKLRQDTALKVNALDGDIHQMGSLLRKFDMATKAIERRLGRKHVVCKKCGVRFRVDRATIRMPMPGNRCKYPVAVCPVCEEDN